MREQVARDVEAFVAQGPGTPGLATVLVGDDPASAIYVGGKQKASPRGRASRASTTGCRQTPRTTSSSAIIERLNADPEVSGIIVQLPLPDTSTAPR